MKHYKLPYLVDVKIDTFNLDENKLTEQDCVNEAEWELYTMGTYEAEGWQHDQYGENYARYKRELVLYLARQRKRGIVPNGDYSYNDDPNKKR